MKIDKNTIKEFKIDNLIYIGLLIAVLVLLAIISIRFPLQSDWTYNNRNTLHQSSQDILKQMPDEIFITAFIEDKLKTRNAIRFLISRYRRYKKNITLTFINPKENPAQARAMDIQNNNEVIVSYKNREERLQTLSEEIFSNTLLSLLRENQDYIVFLVGHGERKIDHKANHNINIFAQRLKDKGLNLQTLNLAEMPTIPENTRLFVIANPQTKLLPGEIKIIQHYIDRGGNLLWLTEPNAINTLAETVPSLGVKRIPGIIADYSAELSVGRRDYTLATVYPPHPITRNLGNITLFPQAAGLSFDSNKHSDFQHNSFLRTSENSWTETDPQFSAQPNIAQYDKNSSEQTGPIVFGVSASRLIKEKEQRIAIIGDADFIANAYLGNAGNLEFGLNLFNWLSHDDQLLTIKPLSAPDTQLQLSNNMIIFIAITFFLAIPIGLFSTGLIIWWKRNKR